MAGFDDILKSVQWQQNIQKSLGLSSQLSEIFKAHEKMTSSFSGLNAITDLAKSFQQQQKTMQSLSGISMLSELTKSMQQQDRLMKSLSGVNMLSDIAKSMQMPKTALSPTFSAFDVITKSMKHSNFGIPQSTFDAITSINRQHEQLYGNLRSITDALKIQSPAIAQINSLNFALSGISGQIAALAAEQKNWTIIEDFEEVTEQAIEFSESLTEEVTEEQQRQFQILLTLITTFINKHTQKGIYTIRFLEVILLFYTYYGIFFPKSELAEKENIRQIDVKLDTVTHYISLVNEQLKQAKEYRITNRVCEVKLKPKSKSLTLTKLPKDLEVIVIQIHHKWILVSYFDPKDNLPQTGWIMKKYLNKPE